MPTKHTQVHTHTRTYAPMSLALGIATNWADPL